MMDRLVDWAAFGVVVSTIAGWLPSIAALFSITWLGIQIYEWYQKKKK